MFCKTLWRNIITSAQCICRSRVFIRDFFRCVDSGLWVPDANKAKTSSEDGTEDAEEEQEEVYSTVDDKDPDANGDTPV